MRFPHPRVLLNALILGYLRYVRVPIRKHSARVWAILPDLVLPAGWAFLTWSMFLWNARAWAASVGVYLVLSGGIIPIVTAYFDAKAASRRVES